MTIIGTIIKTFVSNILFIKVITRLYPGPCAAIASRADRGLVLKTVLTVQEIKGTAVGMIGRNKLRN